MPISYVPVEYDPFAESRRAPPVPGLPEDDERFVQTPEAIRTKLPGAQQVSYQAGQMPKAAGVSYEPVDYDPWETGAPAGAPDPDAPAGPRADITPPKEEEEEWTPPTWESLWESFKTTKVYATPEPEYMKQRFQGGLINVELAGLETLNRDRGETPEREARVAQLEAQLKEMGLHEDNRALLEIGVGFVAEQIPIQAQILKGGAYRGLQGAMLGGVTGSVAAPGPGTLAGTATGLRVGMAVGVAEQAYYLEGGLAYNEFKKLRDDAGKPIQREVAVWASRGVGATNAAIEVLQLKTAVRFIPGGERLLRRLQTETVKKVIKSKGLRKTLTAFGKKLAKFTGIETGQETTQEIVNVVAEELSKALENDLRGANFKLATEDKETFYTQLGRIGTVAKETALGMGMTGIAGGVTIGAGKVAVKKVKGQREIEEPTPETDLTDREKDDIIIREITGRVAKGEITESQFAELETQFPKGTAVGDSLRIIRDERKIKAEPTDLTDPLPEDEPIPLEQEVFAGTEKAFGVRLAGDKLTGQMRESSGIPAPEAYPELSGVSAEESAAVFKTARNRELRERQSRLAWEERTRQSAPSMEELKEELRAREEFEEVYGIEGLASYMTQLEEMVQRGEPGGRIRVKDEVGAGEEWYGYSSTYPEFMVSTYGSKETLIALGKGMTGEPMTPRQAGIWEDAKDYAKDMRRRDLVEYGKMVEEMPEEMRDLSDTDYKVLLEGLENEGYSTRDIEEAAARYRGTIEEAIISEIAEEAGVEAGRIESLIQEDPELRLSEIYDEAVAAEYLAMPPSGEEEINAQRLREDEGRLRERRAAVEEGEVEGSEDLEQPTPETAGDEEAQQKELPNRVEEIEWDRWQSGAEEAAAIPGEPIWFLDADEDLENAVAAVVAPEDDTGQVYYIANTPEGTPIKLPDQENELHDTVESAMLTAQDWVAIPAQAEAAEQEILPPGNINEVITDHVFNFPTVPSKPGNLLMQTNDSIIYESTEPIHAVMLDEFDVAAEDVRTVGIVEENGDYLWEERGIEDEFDFVKRLEKPEEFKEAAKEQKKKEEKEKPKLELVTTPEEDRLYEIGVNFFEAAGKEGPYTRDEAIEQGRQIEEVAGVEEEEEDLIEVPGTDIKVKRLSKEDVTEYFKRYGVPNAIDEGQGVFGNKAGRLFIDDDTGEPVGYVPASEQEKPPKKEEPAEEPAGVPEKELKTGKRPETTTGRKTTPVPKIDTTTNRKAQNTIKRVDAWLVTNAIDEANSRNDDFNLTQFEGMNPKSLSPSDRDSLNEYLWGDFIPPVIRPITKPLAPAREPGTEAPPTEERATGEPVKIPAQTEGAITTFNDAKTGDDFRIALPDGSNVSGYFRNADFPGEYDKPTRGEIFYVESESKRAGVATSLAADALRLMQANGATTVKLSLRTTPEGTKFADSLVEKGLISEPLKASRSGITDHTILVGQEGPAAPKPTTLQANMEARYPRAPAVIENLVVREDVPNLASISASMNDWTELPGVREVSMGEFSDPDFSSIGYSNALSKEISESGEINPLIVVIDDQGSYILEGGHRFDALQMLRKKAFPALVVMDNEALGLVKPKPPKYFIGDTVTPKKGSGVTPEGEPHKITHIQGPDTDQDLQTDKTGSMHFSARDFTFWKKPKEEAPAPTEKWTETEKGRGGGKNWFYGDLTITYRYGDGQYLILRESDNVLDQAGNLRDAKRKAEAIYAESVAAEEPEAPAPEAFVPKDGWRTNLIKAREYAIGLGIETNIRKENWNKLKRIVAQIDSFLGTPAKEIGDLGTIGAWNIPNLSEFFLNFIRAGQKMNKVIIQKNVAEEIGTTRAKMTKDPAFKHKPLEEAFEYAIVKRAREIIAAGGDWVNIYQDLETLYNSQPNFATRTSKSMQAQAYSTPVHLAYLMQVFTEIGPKSWVYEPTAGTGMLLTSAEPSTTMANELDPDRLIILNDQNFLTYSEDATDNIIGGFEGKTGRRIGPQAKAFDVVIGNPPFGKIRPRKTLYDHKIGKLEHQIIMRSLEAMKPDGKAAFIIGGQNFKNGKMLEDDRVFFNWLYHNYNVELNADIPGTEYGRQGTSFPVRLLVINGKKATPAGYAPDIEAAYDKIENVSDLINDVRRIQNARLATPRITEVPEGEAAPGGPAGPGPRPAGPPGVPRPVGEQAAPTVPEEPEPTGPAPTVPAEGVSPAGEPTPAGAPGLAAGGVRVEPTPEAGAGAVPAEEERPGPGEGEPGAPTRGPKPSKPEAIPPGAESTRPGVIPGTEPGLDLINDLEGAFQDELKKKKPSEPSLKESAQKANEANKDWKKAISDGAAEINALLEEEAHPETKLMVEWQDISDTDTMWLKIKNVLQKMLDTTLAAGKKAVDFAKQAASELGEKAFPFFQKFIREEMTVPNEAKESDYQTIYRPKSKGPIIDETLIPKNMRQSVEDALDNLEKEVGDIDDYVVEKLQYSGKDELFNYLSADQVDGVALAIWNMDKGFGMIIGDQTGVGKGRIAAAVWKYAKLLAKKPIFFTAKPQLFSDFYRDILDTGQTFDPMIMASNAKEGKILSKDKKSIYRKILSPEKRKEVYAAMAERGIAGLPEENDGVVVTYSQINEHNIQQAALAPAFDNNVILLDESHKAAGPDSNTGDFIRSALQNVHGVTYLSATFAKRANTMPVYYKTGISVANLSMDDLITAVENGGVPLQEILASDLAKIGQMIRREKSFRGVANLTFTDTKNRRRDETRINSMTSLMREIMVMDKAIFAAIKKAVRDARKKGAQTVFGIPIPGSVVKGGKRVSSTVKRANFAATAHNAVRQLLLSIKCDLAIGKAVEALGERSHIEKIKTGEKKGSWQVVNEDGRVVMPSMDQEPMDKKTAQMNVAPNGRKPFISLDNTMGSFVDYSIQQGSLDIGGEFDIGYATVLRRNLDRALVMVVKNPQGKKESHTINVNHPDFPSHLRDIYHETIEKIHNDTSGLPGSPIDYITSELKKKGFNIGEITGRKYRADIADPDNWILRRIANKEPTVAQREKEHFTEPLIIPDKQTILANFNDGALDGVIVNRSGAEGVSAHASLATGSDLRPRIYLGVQAQLNVDDEMQLYGRINRKGQVVLPSYIQLFTDTPAERRPASVLMRKMKSLSANTSANSDSPLAERTLPDLNNKYGNQVVREWLRSHQQLANEMGLKADADDYVGVSGKIAMQPIPVQRDFFDEVELEYESLKEELVEQGLWDLELVDIDFKAQKLDSSILTKGEDEEHPFGKSTYREKMSVINPTRPYQRNQLENLVNDSLQGLTPEQFNDDLLERIEKQKDAFVSRKEAEAIEAEKTFDDTQVRQAWEYVHRNLKHYMRIGNTYNMDLGDELPPMVGVLLNIKHSEASGNPANPSRTRMVFAVNNSLRRITVPLSKVQRGHADVAHYETGVLESWDDITSKDLRADRYIITGNLLQGAADMTSGSRFIRFTDENKRWNEGILMPMNYDPGTEEGKVRINTDQALEAIQEGVDLRGSTATVTQISAGQYRIELPQSRRTGGPFFMDEKLMSHVVGDQFETTGQKMRAVIKPTNKDLSEAIRRIHDLGDSFAITRSDYDRLFTERAPETVLMVGEQNPQAARPTVPDVINFNNLEKVRTVSRLFPQWLSEAGLPQEMIDKISLELNPLIKLTPQEMENSKAQWEKLGVSVKNILGATTFNKLFTTVQLATMVQNVQDMEKTTFHEAYHIAKRFLMPKEAISTIERLFKNEEAEANAFRDFMITRKVTGVKNPSMVHKMWMQLRRLLSIIKNGLAGKGFARPEDVFGQMVVGAYGANVRMMATQDPVTSMSINKTDPRKQWADTFIEEALKNARSEKAKRIKKEQEYFEGEGYVQDTLQSAKDVVKAIKFGKRKGWTEERPDTTVLERLLQSPEFYFKKVKAAWRVFNASLDRVDEYHHYYNQLTGEESLLTTLSQLEKERPVEYEKLSNLIVHADMNKVMHNPESLRKAHFSDQAINAWIAFRQMMDNGFDLLFADMKEIIRKHEEAGLPIPEVSTWMGDKKIKVNLKVAMARMGEMRAYYAPRSRKTGRYQLVAKKPGSNPYLEYFDTKTFINRRAAQLEKQGYTTKLSKSRKMPEDVFEIAGRTIGLQAMINRALEVAIPKGEINLATFGIEGAWSGSTYVVKGPASQKMAKVFKRMGGKYFARKKGDARRWNFIEASDDIETTLVQALAAHVQMPGASETDLLFAEALATQVANIVKGRGFRASMIKRGEETAEDVWLGYEQDPLKGASQYLTGIAGGMAKKNMATKMVKAVTGTDIDRTAYDTPEAYMEAVKARRIDPEKQQNIFKDVMSYMNEMLRNQEFADRVIGTIKGITVIKYLGFRLSAPLVNLTALLTSVPASMRAHAGVDMADVPKYLVKAMTAYGRYKWGDRSKLDEDTVWALDEIHGNNWHSAQYNQEALAVLRSKFGGAWQKAMDLSMLMFGATEQLNRISTILGTYMALKDQGQIDRAEMLKKAKYTSDRSHGTYGKTTLPYLAHGSNPFAQAAKSFYVFSKFSHTYLQNMYEIGFKKKDRTALLYMAIAPAILSGGAAVPLIGPAMMSAIGQLFKGFGDDRPEEGEEALYAWLDDNLGTMSSDFARFGLVGLGGKGVSLKGSLQIDIGGSIPSSIPEMFGAPGNVLMDVWHGGKSILKGDIYRGIEKAGPRFTGSILQGIREYKYGVTTYSNVPKFLDEKQMQPDSPDTILRILNFNPAGVAKMKERKWAQSKLIRKYRQKRSDIYARFRAYYQKAPADRTVPAYNSILVGIQEYNATVKRNRLHALKGISLITKKSLEQSVRLKR